MPVTNYGMGLAIGVATLSVLWGAAEPSQAIEAISRPDPLESPGHNAVAWYSNYRAALEEGRRREALVLIWFVDRSRRGETETMERNLFVDKDVRERLAAYVCVKLPLDASVIDAATATAAAEVAPRQTVRLLDHEAFAELRGGSGVAIIDMRHPGGPHFQRVVSVFPCSSRRLSKQQLMAFFDLPEGSLTQRTLIWAVRMHDQRPQSASGNANPLLMKAAESHAWHQAKIGRQGHHGWDERFQEINGQLPAGLVAQEICAESWPGQSLVEAALECVDSWRQSPGHWNAVCTAHPHFGFDMQRGVNGVWYATGIFGRQP